MRKRESKREREIEEGRKGPKETVPKESHLKCTNLFLRNVYFIHKFPQSCPADAQPRETKSVGWTDPTDCKLFFFSVLKFQKPVPAFTAG